MYIYLTSVLSFHGPIRVFRLITVSDLSLTSTVVLGFLFEITSQTSYAIITSYTHLTYPTCVDFTSNFLG